MGTHFTSTSLTLNPSSSSSPGLGSLSVLKLLCWPVSEKNFRNSSCSSSSDFGGGGGRGVGEGIDSFGREIFGIGIDGGVGGGLGGVGGGLGLDSMTDSFSILIDSAISLVFPRTLSFTPSTASTTESFTRPGVALTSSTASSTA